jgi:hypothetical protein
MIMERKLYSILIAALCLDLCVGKVACERDNGEHTGMEDCLRDCAEEVNVDGS